MKTLALIVFTLQLIGQEVPYSVVTPSTTLTWSTTNVPPPTGYALYFTTSGPVGANPVRRVTSQTNSIQCSVLFSGMTNGLYNIEITAFIGVTETHRSTNLFLYWVPPPQMISSGITAITIK